MIGFSMTAFFLVVTAILGSCSNGGDGKSGDPSPAESPAPSALPVDESEIGGRLFLGSMDSPASGLSIWLVDYTGKAVIKQAVGSAGEFSFSTALLREEGSYSFHVVDDRSEEVAIFDWDQAPGLQGVVRFFGGIGVNVGDIVLPTNIHGLVDIEDQAVTVGIGGSLQVDESIERLGVNALNGSTLQIFSDPRLVITDSGDLLFGVYRRRDNFAFYSEVLDKSQRSVLTVSSQVPFTQLYLVEGGTWTRSARVHNPQSPTYEASLPWAFYGNSLVKKSSIWQIDLFTTRRSTVNSQLSMFALDQDKKEYSLSIEIESQLSAPPVLSSISLDNGPVQQVDYTDSTIENGLSIAFCLTESDVVFQLDAPSFDGRAFEYSKCSLNLFYYDDDGILLAPNEETFSSPYDKALEDAAGRFTRIWDPTTVKLVFSSSMALGDQGTYTVPSELMVDLVNSATVAKVKVQYQYESEEHYSIAGAHFWLKKCRD